MRFKIFLNESIFGKSMIPDYATFLKKEDPELYKDIIENLEEEVNYQRKITDEIFNIEINNYLYNSQYNNHFESDVNDKLISHASDLVNLKNTFQGHESIPTGKRKRKRIRVNRI